MGAAEGEAKESPSASYMGVGERISRWARWGLVRKPRILAG